MKQIKQIKTITKRREYTDSFDNEVNKALYEGWVLVRRYISNGRTAGVGEPTVFYPILVAELERMVHYE